MTPDPTGEPPSTGRHTLTPRAAFWCALSIWVLTLAMAVGARIYSHVHPLPPALRASAGNTADGVAAVTLIVGFATVGALLAWKRPANPIGWLLSATGLCYACAVMGGVLLQFPGDRTWGNWLGWLFFLGIGFVVFVLLLFPTGSLPSRRWRPVAWAAGAGMAAWALGNAFAPVPIASGSANPIGVAGPAGRVFGVLGRAGVLLIVAAGVAAIVSLVCRYRRAGSVEREQLKWLVYTGALIVVATLALIPVEAILGLSGNAATNLENATTSGAVALVPIAIGIAIFRYHLYDIDVVINKTLVYGSLAIFITGVYVAIVVGIGSLAQRGARPSLVLSIAATAVVAVAFQPVRERVQRLANRLVYGRRATPYEVLADFAGRMAGAYAAEDLLPRMARILAEGTGAARADVWLKDGDTFHDDAVWPPDLLPKAPARATQADVPAYPADRTLPVRYEGELLGIASALALAGSVAGRDDERERALIARLRAETSGALATLRELARGIYPPLLAEQGLAAALQAQAAKAPGPVAVSTDGIGRYPAEIETAVYFCCVEALQNAARHAPGSPVRVRLADTEHGPEFEVADDGPGFDPAAAAGSGLRNMDDRLAALGGSCRVDSSPGRGTTVAGRVMIPGAVPLTAGAPAAAIRQYVEQQRMPGS
jgi:signal transduction histidine kinase